MKSGGILKIDILTLFPEMFEGVFQESILKRAREKGLVEINFHNFREFSKDPHKKVDDTPYGGGGGMVLCCQPIFDCVKSLRTKESTVILLTPSGKKYTEQKAKELAGKKHLILICGHYEGFDERIRYLCDEEISIGDYVLTGGEIPSMVLVDSITRLLPGVIKEESYVQDSFYQNSLDFPTYTKPAVYEGYSVPEILLSGDHAKIKQWRKEMAEKKTQEIRPDLKGEEVWNDTIS